ncbi:MAG: fatty acid desaturase [Gammaproteobacteria bacterium]|nr:fatty acid desaturase [Gammaproteobacteria bacterium]
MSAWQLVLFASLTMSSGSWFAYPLLWVLPIVTFYTGFNSIRSMLEHAHTDDSSDRHFSFRSNPLERFFLAPWNMNFHAEHHLYMAIPYHQLPALRQYLGEKGDPSYQVFDSYLARYRWLSHALAQVGKGGIGI